MTVAQCHRRGGWLLSCRLAPDGCVSLLERLWAEPPRGPRWLDGVTWSDFAARYGDRANDEVFHLDAPPSSKRAAAYLLTSALVFSYELVRCSYRIYTS